MDNRTLEGCLHDEVTGIDFYLYLYQVKNILCINVHAYKDGEHVYINGSPDVSIVRKEEGE